MAVASVGISYEMAKKIWETLRDNRISITVDKSQPKHIELALYAGNLNQAELSLHYEMLLNLWNYYVPDSMFPLKKVYSYHNTQVLLLRFRLYELGLTAKQENKKIDETLQHLEQIFTALTAKNFQNFKSWLESSLGYVVIEPENDNSWIAPTTGIGDGVYVHNPEYYIYQGAQAASSNAGSAEKKNTVKNNYMFLIIIGGVVLIFIVILIKKRNKVK
jgi:hypothetical protein